LDLNGVVLPVIGSDSLGLWIEEVLLSSSVLSPSSEVHVVSTMSFNNSLHWKSGSEVEWSVGMETEISDESLFLDLFSFINVDNLPFLVGTSISLVYLNVLVFNILVSFDIKDSVVFDVCNEFSFKNEELPPS
jgi:hypothetical protein